MGYDPVQGINTYGARCLAGAERQFAWWREHYQAGSLGCYNPASVASSGPSLHAEGRAMDIALNANDPAQRARGDAIVARVVAHPEMFGAQEMLWRGGVWTWRRRAEGWRTNPPTQQAAHMNHVHLGLDVNAGKNWTSAWVTDDGDEMNQLQNAVLADTYNRVKAIQADVDDLQVKVAAISSGGSSIDEDALVDRIVNELAERLKA